MKEDQDDPSGSNCPHHLWNLNMSLSDVAAAIDKVASTIERAVSILKAEIVAICTARNGINSRKVLSRIVIVLTLL